MIEQEKVPMLKYAMHYGAILGLFWIVKYLFVIIGGFAGDVFIYLSSLLSVGTFMLVYTFYFKYRDSDPDKQNSIVKCILFVAAMAFFASIFEGAIMYIHYEVIHPEYFRENIVKPIVEIRNELNNLPSSSITMLFNQMMDFIADYTIVSAVLGFIGNIVILTFLSLVIGLFADKRKAQ